MSELKRYWCIKYAAVDEVMDDPTYDTRGKTAMVLPIDALAYAAAEREAGRKEEREAIAKGGLAPAPAAEPAKGGTGELRGGK